MQNPGYYVSLKHSSLEYPCPYPSLIEVDLRRTYADETDLDKVEKDIVPLRNLLNAYVQRCPSIGYCQGFSFIAARLLSVMPEEEAFWTFVQTVEVVLPLDYYTNLIGVLVDICVFEELVQRHLPKLIKHL